MDLGTWKDWVMGFVVIAIIISIGGTILTQVLSTQCVGGTSGFNATTGLCLNAGNTTVASNATTQGVTGINTFGTWLPTIAVILAAAVVIGVIVAYFA